MITAIATWLLSRQLTRSPEAARMMAKVGLAIAVLLAIAGGFTAWLALHDADVVDRHETRAKRDQATAAIAAEHQATTNAVPREEARAAAAAQSADAMKEAEDAHPEAAKAAAGPVTRAAAQRFPVR